MPRDLTTTPEADGPLRLAIVEPHGTGGMSHYAYQLAGAFAGAGASVTLITSSDYELATLPHAFDVQASLRLWPHHAGAPAATAPGSLGRATSTLRRLARRPARAARLLVAWVELARALPSQGADIVQFGHLRFPFEGLFLAYLRRRGLLLSDICHEIEPRERSSSVLRRAAQVTSRGVYREFDAIFLHGETNRTAFCEAYPALRPRTHVIPHGNENVFHVLAAGGGVSARELRLRYRLTESEPVMVFFGNVTPSKGLDDLLRAHAIIRSRLRVRLIVAGYPSRLLEAGSIERLCSTLGVEESVTLDLRYIPNEEVGALMELATLVVLPYRSATESGVLQLAYSFARPVVATRVGGLPDSVEHGVSGLLVPPRSPDALAAAIERLLVDSELARTMGEAGARIAAERHDWDDVVRSMLPVYRNLVARRRG